MRKKTNVPPLPPLSDLKVLKLLHDIEAHCRQWLRRDDRYSFSFDRTVMTLRGCIVNLFDVKVAYYKFLRTEFNEKWVKEIREQTIASTMTLAPDWISAEELGEIERILCRTLNEHVPQWQNQESQQAAANVSRRALYESYTANFPGEKIKVLDICWAAGQHYREWKRWLKNELRDGSTPDLAIRQILTSGKRPHEFKSKPRPPKWQ